MSFLGEDIKKLGFGLMRLPKKDDVIDIEQTRQMVDMFLNAGFTYFDTAWAYPGSEDAIRQALVERYPRESFQLATKNAAWLKCNTKEDAIAQFETSLKQTGAGYFDFYLLHNLGQVRTGVFDEYGLWDWASEQKAAGLIKHLGFSAHTNAEELEEIIKAHSQAEFVQLQINYADWENPSIQSGKCYEVARKYDLPVIIMEPVKGGMLADPPEAVKKILKEASPDASCSSWAIKYAADKEGVITVLSGMSNMEQMEDNISFMKEFNGLTDEERKVLKKASDAINGIPIIPCTSCDYCAKVCPMEVGISGSFSAMNILTIYGDMEKAKNQMEWFVKRQQRKHASECIKCGACEAVCPQHISIISELGKVSEALRENE